MLGTRKNRVHTNSREQGFTTYFQGANSKDEKGNTVNPSKPGASSEGKLYRTNRGWGSPISMILGRKLQTEKEIAVVESDEVNAFSNVTTSESNLNDSTINSIITDYKIRIRFTSTWRKSKSISLCGIRLHLRNAPISTSSSSDCALHHLSSVVKEVDLLDTESVQVTILSDFMQLPTTHDASRTLDNLLSTATNLGESNQQYWTCPISSHPGASIEINISGDLNPKYLSLIEAASNPVLVLSVWNGLDSDTDSSSAVKDLSIFFNGQCAFAKSMRAERSLCNNEPTFSLTLPLNSAQTSVPDVVNASESILTPRIGSSSSDAPEWLSNLRTISRPSSSLRYDEFPETIQDTNTNTNSDIVHRSGCRRSSMLTQPLSNSSAPCVSPLATIDGLAVSRMKLSELTSAAYRPTSSGSRSRRVRTPVGTRVSLIMPTLDEYVLCDKLSDSAVVNEASASNSFASPILDAREQFKPNDEYDSINVAKLNPSQSAISTAETPLHEISTLSNIIHNGYNDESSRTERQSSLLRLDRPAVEASSKITMTRDKSKLELRAQRLQQVQGIVQSTLAVIAGVVSTGASITATECNGSNPISQTNGPIKIATTSIDLQVDHSASIDSAVSPACRNLKDSRSSQMFKAVELSQDLLPQGKVLRIEIYSTWGDQFFVGLNGLELFDKTGQLLKPNRGIEKIKLIHPKSEVDNFDARKVENLIDCINFTRDDEHIWLVAWDTATKTENSTLFASYGGSPPLAILEVSMTKTEKLSKLRVFNYNKSRTHSNRGVRACRVTLDGVSVYEGELKQASGLLTSLPSVCQDMVFTTDPNILEHLHKYDDDAGYTTSPVDVDELGLSSSVNSATLILESRPTTSECAHSDAATTALIDNKSTSIPSNAASTAAIVPSYIPLKATAIGTNLRGSPSLQKLISIHEERPFSQSLTSVRTDISMKTQPFCVKHSKSHQQPQSARGITQCYGSASSFHSSAAPGLCKCRSVRIEINSTWGDETYFGLTGLQLLTLSCSALPLQPRQLRTEPRDLSSLGFYDDPRVPENLISTVNNTTDETNMWLAPFTPGSRHEIEIILDEPTLLAGFRVWNYNKGSTASNSICNEEVLKGVRGVRIFVDSQLLGKWEFRVAPGYDSIDYSQTCFFQDISQSLLPYYQGRHLTIQEESNNMNSSLAPANWNNAYLRQDYEPHALPTGQLWTFTLLENLNDPYYIGLDGIEFYDVTGKLVDIQSCGGSISALPHSLNVLSTTTLKEKQLNGLKGNSDPRTPRKIIAPWNDFNNCGDNHCHSWLAPLSRCMTDEERSNSGGTQAESSSSNRRFPYDNTIFIMFPYPVTLSYIRLFNYSKSQNRGVKDLAIYVDNKLLFIGSLKPADKEPTLTSGIQGNVSSRQGQTIVFSKDLDIIRLAGKQMNYCGSTEQDVLCINERQVMVKSKAMFEQPNTASEGILSNLLQRPTTAFH